MKVYKKIMDGLAFVEKIVLCVITVVVTVITFANVVVRKLSDSQFAWTEELVINLFVLLIMLGCGLCGLSVGILWPGTFSVATVRCPRGGTAMFALLALAGDAGCSLGPTLVNAVSGLAGGDLKAGMLAAVVFPLLLIVGLTALRRSKGGAAQ